MRPLSVRAPLETEISRARSLRRSRRPGANVPGSQGPLLQFSALPRAATRVPSQRLSELYRGSRVYARLRSLSCRRVGHQLPTADAGSNLDILEVIIPSCVLVAFHPPFLLLESKAGRFYYCCIGLVAFIRLNAFWVSASGNGGGVTIDYCYRSVAMCQKTKVKSFLSGAAMLFVA